MDIVQLSDNTSTGIFLFVNIFLLAIYIQRTSYKKALVNCVGYLTFLTVVTFLVFDSYGYFMRGLGMIWIVVGTFLIVKWWMNLKASRLLKKT